MRHLRLAGALVVAVIATACGGTGSTPDRVAVAAGAQVIPEPTTTTTTTVAPAPTTTTTRRPPATTTSTTRPPAPPTTPAPAPRPRGPYPPGVSGTTLSATTTSGSTTLSLRLFPGDQYFGERVQVGMDLSSRDAVRSVKVDFGNGTVVDATPSGFNCPGTVRSLNPAAPNYTYPAPGRYVVRAIVTEAPCVPFPATPPPGFPSEAPDPFSPDRVVEVSLTFEQAADRPPRPVGPPPGA